MPENVALFGSQNAQSHQRSARCDLIAPQGGGRDDPDDPDDRDDRRRGSTWRMPFIDVMGLV